MINYSPWGIIYVNDVIIRQVQHLSVHYGKKILSNCWSDGHEIFTIGAPPPVEYFNDDHVVGHVVQVPSWKNRKTLHLYVSKTVDCAG